MLRSSIQSPNLLAELSLTFPAYTGYRPRNAFSKIVQGTWKQPSIPNTAGALQAHIGQVLRIAPYIISGMKFHNSDCFLLDDPTITLHIVSRFNIGLDPFTNLPNGVETPVDVSTLPDPSLALLGNDYNTFSGWDFPPATGIVPLVSLYENDAPGRHPGQTGDIIPTVWNMKAEVKANWILADLFSTPISVENKIGPPSFVLFSVAYGLTHNVPTVPPPIPPGSSTIPIDLEINTGTDPSIPVAVRVGVLQNSPLNQSVWEPTENARFNPDVLPSGDYVDVIGYDLTVQKSTIDNPGSQPSIPGGTDVITPIFDPTIIVGRKTYHVWLGDLSKAAPDFVGYLIHTEDTNRKTFNPPAGIIYPFYTTPRTFP